MKKNVLNFPKPPVDLEDLKTQLDRFDSARPGALDGGRTAFAELKAARKVLTHSLDHLGHYVEAVCKDDVATFVGSGFELAGGGRVSDDLCPIPGMLWVRQGNNSGELVAAWTPLYRKAGHYELRWGAQGPNGEPPGRLENRQTHSGQTSSTHRGADSRHDLRLSSASVWKERRIYGLEQLRFAVHINKQSTEGSVPWTITSSNEQTTSIIHCRCG